MGYVSALGDYVWGEGRLVVDVVDLFKEVLHLCW